MRFEGYTDGRTKEIIDGYMSSGDMGHFDEDGLLFVDGRDDDMIVSGGENVFPQEVENLLVERADVSEAAVVGVDDAEFGKRLRAFVVPEPGAPHEAEEIKLYVKNNLARHKVPRDVVFIDELPRNATGKLLRRVLVEMDVDTSPTTAPSAPSVEECMSDASGPGSPKVPRVDTVTRRQLLALARGLGVAATVGACATKSGVEVVSIPSSSVGPPLDAPPTAASALIANAPGTPAPALPPRRCCAGRRGVHDRLCPADDRTPSPA